MVMSVERLATLLTLLPMAPMMIMIIIGVVFLIRLTRGRSPTFRCSTGSPAKAHQSTA